MLSLRGADWLSYGAKYGAPSANPLKSLGVNGAVYTIGGLEVHLREVEG
jgi:hypothetical protein